METGRTRHLRRMTPSSQHKSTVPNSGVYVPATRPSVHLGDPEVEEVTACMRKQTVHPGSSCKAVFDKPVVTTVSSKVPAED